MSTFSSMAADLTLAMWCKFVAPAKGYPYTWVTTSSSGFSSFQLFELGRNLNSQVVTSSTGGTVLLVTPPPVVWVLAMLTRHGGAGPNYNYTARIGASTGTKTYAGTMLPTRLVCGAKASFTVHSHVRIARMAVFTSDKTGSGAAWAADGQADWGDAIHRWEFGDTSGDDPTVSAQDVGTTGGKDLPCFNMVAGALIEDHP